MLLSDPSTVAATDVRAARRIRAAAAVLFASLPSIARAADAGAAPETPATQLDISGLLYGEASRVAVIEPIARLTHRFANGQSLSGQLGVDGITGASPTGALPSGKVTTVTSASGNVTTSAADEIPTTKFNDLRASFDADYTLPVGTLFKSTLGGHFSREKDYQSTGANAQFSLDVLQRLSTITVGGGFNHDTSFPTGGTHSPFTDGTTVLTTDPQGKDVTTWMVGLSRVVTRRLLVGANVSGTNEKGYLTEPYKVLSVVDTGGYPVSTLSEKRPDTRARKSVLGSAVYQLADDGLYLSYRRYWADWDIRSHTVDVRYRHELGGDAWWEPHFRYYAQSEARFHTWGFAEGAALPQYATSDYRLGKLNTLTLGLMYGFHLLDYPGTFTIRGEYLSQFGEAHPEGAVGVQKGYSLMPGLSIGSLTAGYSIGW